MKYPDIFWIACRPDLSDLLCEDEIIIHMRSILLLAVCLLLANSLYSADDSNVRIKRFDTNQPRDFGYVIGDTFEHELIVEVNKPYELIMESVPAAGRLDLWLELATPLVDKTWALDATTYRIHMRYQIINAPARMQQLFTPEVTLEFADGADMFSVSFKSWQFHVSPITASDGGQSPLVSSLQPDLKPPAMRTWPTVTRAVLASMVLLAVVSYLLYIYLALPWLCRHRYPFSVAYRRIKSLQDITHEDRWRKAIVYLHHALNQTAGKTLFASNLAYLFEQHPEFLPVQPELQKVFEDSCYLFFADETSKPAAKYGYDQCLKLARMCRGIERSPK